MVKKYLISLEDNEKLIFVNASGQAVAISDCSEWDVVSIIYNDTFIICISLIMY